MLITTVFNGARNNKYTILETFYEEHIKAARQLGNLYISNPLTGYPKWTQITPRSFQV